ncbi:MAG: bacteriohemerythrin [Treponema sp.]|nr:bacteriohemerythrin [Treponema sp.]
MSEKVIEKALAKDALVLWSKRYATNIPLFDKQHKELVSLTNNLYEACKRKRGIEEAFKEAIHDMVEYVSKHFAAEVDFMESIGFPEDALAEHKRQHETLIKEILGAARNYTSGSVSVPNKFVRTLRAWVLSHIAVYDKAYANFAAERRKNGAVIDII